MDSKFDYTETIENYIRGEMSGDQKLQFENQLNQDPLLREELQMQEDLIDSIQQVRRTELKSRLEGVQVGIFDGITETTGFKVMTTTFLVSAIIGVGSYYTFFNQGDQPLEQVNSEQIAEVTEPQIDQIIDGDKKQKTDKPSSKDSAIVKSDEKEITNEPSASESQDKKEKEAKPAENQTSVIKEERTVDFIPVIPNLDDNFAEEDSTPTNDIDVPDNELGPSEVETKTNFEVETKSDGKNKFHYRFKSGKLILFGDFSGSTYEIIELNSTLGKSFYLYYNNNFYPLSVENTKITELRVLSDKTLIEELKKIKGNN